MKLTPQYLAARMKCARADRTIDAVVRPPVPKAQMATAGIIAFVILLIGVPIFLVKRDLVAGRIRRRRHRGGVTDPLLLYPMRTPDDTPPPAPAWNGRGGRLPSSDTPVVEPGLADVAVTPPAGDRADLRSRDPRGRRKGRDRRAPLNDAEKPRARASD